MNEILTYFPSIKSAFFSYLISILILSISILSLFYKKIRFSLLLHPYEVYKGKRLHTLLTSMLPHQSLLHALINTLFILFFSYDAQQIMTYKYGESYAIFLTLYLLTILILIPNILLTLIERSNFTFTCIGSSGLTFGLIGFSLAYFPFEKVNSIFPFIQYSYQFWIYFLIIKFIFAFFLRKKFNNTLHLIAFFWGTLLALVQTQL